LGHRAGEMPGTGERGSGVRDEEWWEAYTQRMRPDDVADCRVAMRYILRVVSTGTDEEIHHLCRLVLDNELEVS
jgi:hypothetical protein